MTYLNTLKYWRNSLADASRPAIKLKEGKVSYYFAELPDVNLQLGRVDDKLATQIISVESHKVTLNSSSTRYDHCSARGRPK